VNYQVAVQTPQYKMDTLQDLKNTPVVAPNLPRPELLGNLATVERRESPIIVNHYDVQPVFDVLANVQGRDLGGVAGQINKVVNEFQKNLPRGTFLSVRGQVENMNKSFAGIGAGILFAIVLVYFVMVVNFQSWTDPFIIIMALPGALCGIIWMLFVTGTTLNVPSLMGAIMAIGVATANSILVVSFANDERCGDKPKSSLDAALSAGFTRLRPVMMTALAMIIGMLPFSFGLGEGGEQNAPLGRAVIGGLIFATFATLFFVPVVYSILRKAEFTCDEDEEFERQERRGPEGEQPSQ
jgi:multidrug efflux pump subunit AcrB